MEKWGALCLDSRPSSELGVNKRIFSCMLTLLIKCDHMQIFISCFIVQACKGYTYISY